MSMPTPLIPATDFATRFMKFVREQAKPIAGDPAWTHAVRESCRTLAEEIEKPDLLSANYSDPKNHNHEFLLDLIWWHKSVEFGEYCALALESEWRQNIDELERDFWKLIAVKSPLKVFVMSWQNHEGKSTEEVVNLLAKEIDKFGLHLEGENYLILDFGDFRKRIADTAYLFTVNAVNAQGRLTKLTNFEEIFTIPAPEF